MFDTKVLLYYLDDNLGWMNVHKALEKISSKDYHIYDIESNLKVKLNTFLINTYIITTAPSIIIMLNIHPTKR